MNILNIGKLDSTLEVLKLFSPRTTKLYSRDLKDVTLKGQKNKQLNSRGNNHNSLMSHLRCQKDIISELNDRRSRSGKI